MKLLAALAREPLPRTFDDLDDIENIRVLMAHGHVQAEVSQWRFGAPQQAGLCLRSYCSWPQSTRNL